MGMPLREYYRIHRAAELLECKVEDLLHWASIGAIKLYVSFEHGNGYVHFFGDGVKEENRNLDWYTEGERSEFCVTVKVLQTLYRPCTRFCVNALTLYTILCKCLDPVHDSV